MVSLFACGGKTRKNCENTDAYKQGYDAGKMTALMGGTRDPEEFVRQYNYDVGRNVMHSSECFNIGFKDGLVNKPVSDNSSNKPSANQNNATVKANSNNNYDWIVGEWQYEDDEYWTITFNADGTFEFGDDCTTRGTYTIKGNTVYLKGKMICESDEYYEEAYSETIEIAGNKLKNHRKYR